MNDNGRFGNSRFEQHGELLGKHWPAEIVSLRFFALTSPKKLQLFLRFDTLCNNSQLRAAAHTDHCGYDGRIVRSGSDLPDKRLVDLQRIDWNFLR